jgi:hypothetical protein
MSTVDLDNLDVSNLSETEVTVASIMAIVNILVDKGLITPDEYADALKKQVELRQSTK